VADKELETMTSFIQLLNSMDQNKLWIVAMVALIITASYTFKWYCDWKSRQHIDGCLSKLSDIMSKMSSALSKHESTSNGRSKKLTLVLEEIRDRQRNVINKSDSIKIILNEFEMAKKEIISLAEWSIVNNDYEHRKEFVRKKVKTALAEVITLSHKSLAEYSLSVDLEQFFITYIDKKDKENHRVHFKMVDQFWDGIESIYHKENYSGSDIENQQLEEMQIAIANIINAELLKIQLEINNLYR